MKSTNRRMSLFIISSVLALSACGGTPEVAPTSGAPRPSAPVIAAANPTAAAPAKAPAAGQKKSYPKAALDTSSSQYPWLNGEATLGATLGSANFKFGPVTLATGIDGKTGQPTTFPNNVLPQRTNEVMAIVRAASLPQDGVQLETRWIAVDVGNAAPPESEIASRSGLMNSLEPIQSVLQIQKGTFPPGKYRFEADARNSSDEIVGSVAAEFSVSAQAAAPRPAATAVPQPKAPETQPTAQAVATKAPSAAPAQPAAPQPDTESKVAWIKRATLATDWDQPSGKAINPTTSFATDTPRYWVVVDFDGAPELASLSAEWLVVDAGSAAPAGSKFAESDEFLEKASGTMGFYFNPRNGRMPPGKFAVRISGEFEEALTINFTIGGGSPVAPAPQPTVAPANPQQPQATQPASPNQPAATKAPQAQPQQPLAPGRLADSGFRSTKDGFSFQNYGGQYPETKGDLTVDDLRLMFGDAAVCAKVDGGKCTPFPASIKWMESVEESLNNGHCEGFANLSLFIRAGAEPLSKFGGAANTFGLRLENNAALRRAIARNAVAQYTEPVRRSFVESRQKPPSEHVQDLISTLRLNNDPVRFGWIVPGWGGHAVTPYAVDDKGGGIVNVLVYDNNFPGKEAVFVIDTNNESWSYDMAALNPSIRTKKLAGRQGDGSFLIQTPISVRSGVLPAPWQNGLGTANTTLGNSRQVIYSGKGHLSIANKAGQKIGYDGSKFVNEVPGALMIPMLGGLGVDAEPMYVLPLGQEFDITIDGAGLSAADQVDLDIFGVGGTLDIDDIALDPGEKEVIKLGADNTKFGYVAGGKSQPKFSVVVDSTNGKDYQYDLGNVNFEAGKEINFNLNLANGNLGVKNSVKGAQYDMKLTKVSDKGVEEKVLAEVKKLLDIFDKLENFDPSKERENAVVLGNTSAGDFDEFTIDPD